MQQRLQMRALSATRSSAARQAGCSCSAAPRPHHRRRGAAVSARAAPSEAPPPVLPGPLVLYDIASPLQPRSFAPNPSKSRLALGLSGAPFTTRWVDLPDIAALRQGLGVPPVRSFADGRPFYTLPILQAGDATFVGDSFDIAVWLDEAALPAGAGSAGTGRRRLLPPPGAGARWPAYESPPGAAAALLVPLTPRQEAGPHAPYARLNTHVDATFTAHAVGLVAEFLPFNPATAEASRATFAARAGVACWDDLRARGGARRRLLAALEAALAPLAALLPPDGAEEGGPFLEGARATYADAIVGGWLTLLAATMPAEEWAALRGWHGGALARLHDALQERFFVCT